MSRRVVCSHGSSLGTAVQYAGQGKVTFLCVRAARAPARGAPHYRAYPRVYTSLHTRSLAVTLSRLEKDSERIKGYGEKGKRDR